MFSRAFRLTVFLSSLVVVMLAIPIAYELDAAFGASAHDAAPVEQTARPGSPYDTAAIVLAIAITVGAGCLAAGIAVGKVGAAAMGAISENPDIMGRALIFVALAEGIAIYGLIIGIMLMKRL